MAWFISGKKTGTSAKEYPELKIKERLKKIEITGFSRMTNSQEYYEDLLQKLEAHFYNFRQTLIIDFHFEYINTSSMKWLFSLVSSLEELSEKKGIIEINWYYEDDDETILETGEIIKSILKIPFHLKAIKS